MKLFFSPNSPYARKCRVVILEKNLRDIEQIEVSPSENPPALLAVNPLGTVPALQTNDGLHLCESPVICEYLDSLPSEAPSLFSDNIGSRLCILALAALADGIMDAAVTCVMEGRRPAEKQFAATVERKEKAILRTIEKIADAKLDATLPPSIGTLNTAIALEYVSFRLPHLKWPEKHPELMAWLKSVSARESLQKTKPA